MQTPFGFLGNDVSKFLSLDIASSSVIFHGVLEHNVRHRYVHRVNAAEEAAVVFHEVLDGLQHRRFRFQ